jgi:hypothetical protein
MAVIGIPSINVLNYLALSWNAGFKFEIEPGMLSAFGTISGFDSIYSMLSWVAPLIPMPPSIAKFCCRGLLLSP